MELKAIKKFNGKAEGRIVRPGDVIQSNDVERINTLVSGGFCVIVALDSPTAATPPDPADEIAESNTTVEFQGKRYHIETVKAALGVIGVRVAHNAKEKAVNNALAALSDEQAQTLAEALDNNDTTDPNTATD